MRTQLVHSVILYGLATLAVSATAPPLEAQDNIIDRGTSGVRESARLGPQVTPAVGVAADAVAARLYQIMFSPSAVAADGLTAYGGTIGFINRGAASALPFQVRLGYRHLALEEAEDRDRLNVFGMLSHGPRLGKGSDLSTILNYTRTFDSSSKYEVTLAGERPLLGPVTVGLNGTYARSEPDVGDAVDDLVVATGLVIVPSERLDLSLDYEFENDLAGEDDYSATVRLLLGTRWNTTTRLVAGVGKHWTVFTTLVFVL